MRMLTYWKKVLVKVAQWPCIPSIWKLLFEVFATTYFNYTNILPKYFYPVKRKCLNWEGKNLLKVKLSNDIALVINISGKFRFIETRSNWNRYIYITESVFCIDVQPKTEKPLVASGGEDDICYIWDLESGEVKQKLTDFKGQIISECPYEKIVFPKIPTKNFRDFCPSL